MADYFSEMGWRELPQGEAPNDLLHIIRLFRDYGMFDELSSLNGDQLPPPASKAAIDTLENFNITEKGQKCPVCLKEHSMDEVVKRMPCKHTFHSECILPWLAKTNSCPVCRHELATDDAGYEEMKRQKKRAKQRQGYVEDLHFSMYT